MENKEILLNPIEFKVRTNASVTPWLSLFGSNGRIVLNSNAVETHNLAGGQKMLLRKYEERFYLKVGGNDGQKMALKKGGAMEFTNKNFVHHVLSLIKPTLPKEKQNLLMGVRWQLETDKDKDGWILLLPESLQRDYRNEPTK